MNRNNRIVVPTELEASIEATIDVKHSDDDHESVRGVLDAASTDVTSNEEEGKSENAPPKRETKKIRLTGRYNNASR